MLTDEEYLAESLRRLEAYVDTNWLFTHTGVKVFLANPSPAVINVQDIAHSLANLCRYNGQCKKFYNVAEHSVLVATEVLRRTGDRALALSALLHDAPEAYLGDVTGPLKAMLVIYGILEMRFEEAITDKFGLMHPLHHPEIKRSDYEVFFTEKDHLFDFPYEAWAREGPKADVKIECWDPERAKGRFLEMAIELGLAA